MRVWYREDARTIMDYRGMVFGNRIPFRIKTHQIFLLLLVWEDCNIFLRTFAYHCILWHSRSISFHPMIKNHTNFLSDFEISKNMLIYTLPLQLFTYFYLAFLHLYIFSSPEQTLQVLLSLNLISFTFYTHDARSSFIPAI